MQLQGDPLNQTLLADISECKKQTSFICEAERSFLAQKTKCEYIKSADRRNKFFYGIVRKNHKKNYIASIKLADGNMTETEEDYVNFLHQILD